jgi:hypothetical protein
VGHIRTKPTNTVSALCDQRHSPLPQLPAELRNRIFRYVFQEKYIVIPRRRGGKVRLLVEPEDYSNTQSYPLSRLLALTSICRQLRAETRNLPVRLNTLCLEHFVSLTPFVERLPLVLCAEIKCIMLSLLHCLWVGVNPEVMHMCRFPRLERVIVERTFWMQPRRSNNLDFLRCRYILNQCTLRHIEVILE